MSKKVLTSFNKLYDFLHKRPLEERFSGFDPFDGLNSPIVSNSVLGRSRLVRLLTVQFFKRSPINLRKSALIKQGYNPQALGRFLEGYCILYGKNKRQEDLEAIEFLLEKIEKSKIEGYSGACWGYNFAWQARAFYQPKNTPLIVPTNSVFNGLIAAYKLLKRKDILTLALSVEKFITNDLNRTYEDLNFAFSYSPLDNSVVYNASLMATRVLAKIYEINGDEKLLPMINYSTKFCVDHQGNDGHWTYGTKPYHQWIDNFHTGYNLECLAEISKSINSNSYQDAISVGAEYYLGTFFDDKGRSKYYSDKLFPVDIDNPAQLLTTVASLGIEEEYKALTENVINWTINNLQANTGYFYYRKYRFYTNKINYIRWSQSWMFFCMAKYLFDKDE